MMPQIYWIPGPWQGRLAISSRPRGGDWLEDEIRGWRTAGVDVALSLLDADEEEQLGLTEERRLAELHGIRFLSFPIPDRGIPASLEAVVLLLEDLRGALAAGKNVAIHCRQSIGRSAVVAAGTLIAAGEDAQEALAAVGAARGLKVPETPEQQEWIERSLISHFAVSRS